MIDLKAASVHALLEEGIHPFQAESDRGAKLPKMWARSGRKVFLFDTNDIARSVDYVEQNPTFDGLPRQQWLWVKRFEADA